MTSGAAASGARRGRLVLGFADDAGAFHGGVADLEQVATAPIVLGGLGEHELDETQNHRQVVAEGMDSGSVDTAGGRRHV